MANSMASMASEVVPLPAELRNLRPMIRVVQFTPDTPSPLLPLAPIVPETCVPCRLSSSGSQEREIELYPCEPAGQVRLPQLRVTVKAAGADQTLAARSGWV